MLYTSLDIPKSPIFTTMHDPTRQLRVAKSLCTKCWDARYAIPCDIWCAIWSNSTSDKTGPIFSAFVKTAASGPWDLKNNKWFSSMQCLRELGLVDWSPRFTCKTIFMTCVVLLYSTLLYSTLLYSTLLLKERIWSLSYRLNKRQRWHYIATH